MNPFLRITDENYLMPEDQASHRQEALAALLKSQMTLTHLIDRHGLTRVLDLLGDVCAARHTYWIEAGQKDQAKLWARAAFQLADMDRGL